MTIRGDMLTMKRIVDDFEHACRELAMPGGHDPLLRVEITAHHRRCRTKLVSMIRVFVEAANA